MERRKFIKTSALAGAGLLFTQNVFAKSLHIEEFPVVRVPKDKRHFTSEAVENAISAFKKKVKNKELAWLFENCFPNTLDTTVFYKETNGNLDTYVITGDIDAMWLRDSSAQVFSLPAVFKERRKTA
ncbi:glycoside hydrolase family 125 protein [Chryseobacterium daecheongense]|nr:glycoside hydrolase family 125 protein [Chryseobacterium daecheongense]